MPLQRAFLALVLWAFSVAMGQASEAQPTVADPALEARVNDLAAELRCLVCQNQSLADSHADLAIDLKNQVREQLQAGRSEREVIDYMTERYGDFVLYRPPVRASTVLLWAGPLLMLLLGGAAMWRSLGQSAQPGEPSALSAEDTKQLEELLEPGKPGRNT
jgi:cytochrome c-type biogenesis protein CcmH